MKPIFPEKMIHEKDIDYREISNYKCFKLINAMRDFNEVESLTIDSII